MAPAPGQGIVNLGGRDMLVVSVARQLGSGNSSARLLCCPAQAERGGERRLRPVKLIMPSPLIATIKSTLRLTSSAVNAASRS